MSTWIFEGRDLQDEDLKGVYGFLYIITHLPSGRRYLGRKYLTAAATRQVNKKKIKYRKENDWREYYSSSPEIIEQIEREGTSGFKREVILLCATRAQCNYFETMLQHLLGVLHDPLWINSNISSKYFKKNISKYPVLPETILHLLPDTHPAFLPQEHLHKTDNAQ